MDSNYFDYYISKYSSRNFAEDFAEIFAYAVMQPRYISSYGSGIIRPIHNKINKISQILCKEFISLKNSKILLNSLPDIPAQWAEPSVKKAKETGIIPWNIYGLNHSDLTRYDAALILQPLLYKYINENTILKKTGFNKNSVIPENFVYDITNGEDIWLLYHLSVMQFENGRFNPNGKIKNQTAAEILTKFTQLLGLSDIKNIIKINDPDKNITYQEFYSILVNICNLKEEYNKKNKIDLPPVYYKNISITAISETGWLYYYSIYIDDHFYLHSLSMPNIGGFTGKGKINQKNGGYFEGDWKNGVFKNGSCKQMYNDGSWFEGEYKNGIPWNGKGLFIKDGKTYEFKYINGEIKRIG